MSELKLEVGKYYRTRVGEKVLITAIDPTEVDGKCYAANNDYYYYTSDGRYCPDCVDSDDLVALWEEPPLVEERVTFKEYIKGKQTLHYNVDMKEYDLGRVGMNIECLSRDDLLDIKHLIEYALDRDERDGN